MATALVLLFVAAPSSVSTCAKIKPMVQRSTCLRQTGDPNALPLLREIAVTIGPSSWFFDDNAKHAGAVASEAALTADLQSNDPIVVAFATKALRHIGVSPKPVEPPKREPKAARSIPPLEIPDMTSGATTEKWDDDDSRRVAKVLAGDLRTAIPERKPTIAIAAFDNKLAQHVVTGIVHQTLIAELTDVATFIDETKLDDDSMKRGADLVLRAGLAMSSEADCLSRFNYYQATLTLYDARNGQKLAIAVRAVKKSIDAKTRAAAFVAPGDDQLQASIAFNDRDADIAVSALSTQLLRWANGDRRVDVRWALFRNMLPDHFAQELLSARLQQALIASGQVRVFASKSEAALLPNAELPSGLGLLITKLDGHSQPQDDGRLFALYTLEAEITAPEERVFVGSKLVKKTMTPNAECKK